MVQANPERPPREPILNTPDLVAWMIGWLALIHLGLALLPSSAQATVIDSFALIPARYFSNAHETGTIVPGWVGLALPFFTYSLLHASLAHVLLNAVWLLAIGTPVAQRLGGTRFLWFYATTAIAAAVFYSLIRSDNAEPMIGASGAVSGLFGGLSRFIFQVRGTKAPSTSIDRRVLLFAALWLGLNVFGGMAGFGAESGVSAVAWEAHVGGFLAGMLVFPLFDRPPARI